MSFSNIVVCPKQSAVTARKECPVEGISRHLKRYHKITKRVKGRDEPYSDENR